MAALLVLAACRARTEAPASAPTPRAATPAATLDESSEGPVREGGTLQRRLVGEPTTLNAVLQTSLPEALVLAYVQRNLFDFDARLEPRPSLAERMDVSADGRDYVVTLRAEAVWEDGRPVTSEDAVFTIRKIVDPDVPSPVFKALFEDLEKVEALDARRFRVRFREPYAFRSMAFVFPPLPAHRFAGQVFLEAKDNRAPLSNGPYRMVSWKPGESVELAPNPKAWGHRGHFERVVFRILPDNTTAYRGLTSDSLDEDQLDATLKARAETDPAFASCCRLVEFYNLDWSYVALNNRSPFFSDARVRRALTMLSDRASIARNLYRGSARVISGPWAPDSPAYDPALPPLAFDPAAAKKLLSEAGWRDTNGNGTLDREGREFDFELLVSAGSETRPPGRRDARRGTGARRRDGSRPNPRVGGLRRADRCRQFRGGVARLVRRRPESRPVPVLALLAVPAERAEQRLLPERRGRPPHGRGPAGARRLAPQRDLPPAARDFPRGRSGDLSRELHAEVRLQPARPRADDLAARALRDLARSSRLVGDARAAAAAGRPAA